MNEEFSTSTLLQDYINNPPFTDRSVDHFEPTSSTPTKYMSPVTSAASTPPSHLTLNPSMASYAQPVQLSAQPYLSAYPRRAEHSYFQHPYNIGAPPPPPGFPKVRAPQLPTAALVQQSSSSASIPDSISNEPDAPPSGTGGQRKRPKYTRSKKGCLTCRSKKIKCDERQPMCTRCEHGHRECTWPEAVLPRRPKGAVRGVGGDDEEDVEDDGRRPSIAGSTVSTQFPTSATSTHFSSGIPSNSPFEPAPPRRDVFESDIYPAGSQFSMPVIPANTRPFYPRAPVPGQEFYPVTTVNGQPIEEYEFPPRTYGPGSSSGSRGGGGGYPNGALYATGPPGAVTNYNGDLRRASWDSSAPTDGRRPSWDATSLAGGAHTSSVGSPASSSLGLGGLSRANNGIGGSSIINGVGGGPSGAQAVGGGNGNGLMLFQSPDPLSPFFRSVQERNLVGNLSSFAPPSLSSFSSSSSSASPFSSSPSSSASSYLAHPFSAAASNLSASPVLSAASSTDFGMTPEGIAYRKNSYPHLFPTTLPSPLTIDPPAPIAPQACLDGQSFDFLGQSEISGNNKSSSDEIQWLAPPSMEISRPLGASTEEEGFTSWTAYS